MIKTQIPEQPYNSEDTSFFESRLDDFNLLIVTATEIEKSVLHSYMKPVSGKNTLVKIHKGKQTYYLGTFGCYNVVHVNCDSMGSSGAQSSIVTTGDAIQYCKPKAVLMLGIAMGFDKVKQKIGDILIPEVVTPYEVQRVGKVTLQRGIPGTASTTLLNKFKQLTNWEHRIGKRKPERIFGELLSGEKLVDDPVFKAQLMATFPNAKGKEMEGIGIHAACDGKVDHWIVVKAICDYGDGNKKVRKSHNQQLAATSAVNLCRHVLEDKHAFKDIGLHSVVIQGHPASTPVAAAAAGLPHILEVEQKILKEMTSSEKNIPADLNESLHELIRAYLPMSDTDKETIAKRLGVFDEALLNITPDERDGEFFQRVAQKQLLSELWGVLASMSKLKSINPFNIIENESK